MLKLLKVYEGTATGHAQDKQECIGKTPLPTSISIPVSI